MKAAAGCRRQNRAKTSAGETFSREPSLRRLISTFATTGRHDASDDGDFGGDEGYGGEDGYAGDSGDNDDLDDDW